MTLITQGQSLVDVAVQELGSVAALFDLADANGLAITDLLTAGQTLTVPAADAADLPTAAYFASRAQRINTGAQPPEPQPRIYDYRRSDYSPLDYNA
ncbi:LysM peptidoglycan-binding domain-containing protein [Hymenobacter negativus]|uniref:LysM peptidoglycan-binding domain-containing protein n=1 Tax=Hymenobacter negativus TaxID=2795026 RepID=A0ABS3QD37_9BACT|nr:LysM domain-containing protein [Hymenobacter negativus]MBO2009162.1 LysM peptidoglycan-binding domain-containing protein [Hymenobacter negativus]